MRGSATGGPRIGHPSLDALDGVDDEEQLGDRLDGVPCALGAEPS
jgi:hypothetical protein